VTAPGLRWLSVPTAPGRADLSVRNHLTLVGWDGRAGISPARDTSIRRHEMCTPKRCTDCSFSLSLRPLSIYMYVPSTYIYISQRDHSTFPGTLGGTLDGTPAGERAQP
jgi:hypothetical protein